MLDHAIGGVPVVDSHDKLSSIVTASDFDAKERGIPFSLVRASQLFGNWLDRVELNMCRAARTMTAREIIQSRVIRKTILLCAEIS
jgi:CBS-domain-containing membrane protein